MSRQPWDDMAKGGKQRNVPAAPPAILQKTVDPAAEEERQRQNREIVMNRMLFGAITGGLTGLAFGFIDSARKTKIRALDSSAVNKTGLNLARYSLVFGSFYTFYQGARRGIELYAPQPYAESGMLIASCLSLAPFVATAAIRPLTPYAVLLIGLDVWNSVMSPDEGKSK